MAHWGWRDAGQNGKVQQQVTRHVLRFFFLAPRTALRAVGCEKRDGFSRATKSDVYLQTHVTQWHIAGSYLTLKGDRTLLSRGEMGGGTRIASPRQRAYSRPEIQQGKKKKNCERTDGHRTTLRPHRTFTKFLEKGCEDRCLRARKSNLLCTSSNLKLMLRELRGFEQRPASAACTKARRVGCWQCHSLP